MDEVLISVDPHKASSTVAVFDPVTRTPVDGGRFINTGQGFRELMWFARRWKARRWAVEGCHGAGRSLAQRLVAEGESVVDVPAKLAARVRVFSKGHGRKTDRDDAVSIGLAALEADGLREVVLDDATVTLRLLSDRRHELVARHPRPTNDTLHAARRTGRAETDGSVPKVPGCLAALGCRRAGR